MRPFAIVVCGVILTDEQVKDLKAANGGTLPDDVLFEAGDPGKEQLLVGTSLAFTETAQFVKLVSTDMAAMQAEAIREIGYFNDAWGQVCKVDPDKLGTYLGLELLPDRK